MADEYNHDSGNIMSKKNGSKPAVGIGVIIENSQRLILVGKRKGSHAPCYSIPGGHLEIGESFEQGAIREVAEETGLQISNPKVIAVTNNLDTYRQEGYHSISVILQVIHDNGHPRLMEPDKCEGWIWVDPRQLPQPHFDASESAIDCYLNHRFYRQNTVEHNQALVPDVGGLFAPVRSHKIQDQQRKN